MDNEGEAQVHAEGTAMAERSPSRLIRILQAAAYLVIVLVGLRLATPVLGPLLLALLLAYSFLPLPMWLINRFKMKKAHAIVLTIALLGAFQLLVIVLLEVTFVRMKARVPVYAEHLQLLYQQGVAFLNSRGIETTNLSVSKLLTPERLLDIAGAVLPTLGSLISYGTLISLVGWLFLLEMVEEGGGARGPLAERFAYYGEDVKRYIAISAKTGAINAAANFVLLLALGVHYPVLWCVLYFFLNFIPTLGFVMALIPPTALALLMFGWQRALVLACGLMVTNLVVDNVITPIFMKKGVEVSFLTITVSMVFWGFLFGLPGAITAIPLTLAFRKFVERPYSEIL
jgi:predicted PurR-regulated permease PerM